MRSSRMTRRTLAMLIGVAALAALVSAGCATNEPEVAQLPPTKTPKPTFTFTPEWTPTEVVFETATPSVPPTPEPTATLEATEVPPSPTPEPAPSFTAAQNVNVRGGPGTSYPRLGSLTTGDTYDIIGKNATGDWLEFVYDGDPAWVTADMVTVSGSMDVVEVAQNIAPPPPAPTAVPRPPTAVPQPTSPPQPTAVPAPTYDYMYQQGSAVAAPQCGTVNFSGQVQYASGEAENWVCVYLDYYGPRQMKPSGSGGQGAGNWGFSPCGQGDCNGPVTIYLTKCPDGISDGGFNSDQIGSAPPPISDKFTVNITDKCTTGQWTNIIFRGTR